MDPHILRFGAQTSRNIAERKKRWEEAIAGPEREVLEAFLNLPADQKKIARAVILALEKANRVP
jgi:hypothetical protein